ncbi:MAG: DUF2182 domain-containing protein [Alphaproteobacteria bacterium]
MTALLPPGVRRRDGLTALASLLALAALAWAWLWREAERMRSMPMPADDGAMPAAMGSMAMPAEPVSGAMASMAMAPALHDWAAGPLLLTALMWMVMMVGMMLPSAAPAILLYGAMVRRNRARGVSLPAVWTFAAGYLAVWAGFSVAATLAQAGLQQAALLSPMMASTDAALSGALLVAAGLWQWLPLKQACLRKCRAPLQFFMFRWRAGVAGAFRMGVEHGAFCVGCCWAIMLLLFAVGVMNLLWVALIAGFVLAEKLLPAGTLVGRLAGVGFAAAGIWMIAAG